MKKATVFSSLVILFQIILFIGWVKCVYKTFACNWEPIGKAEVFYTVGSVTGLGVVIGWINIEDK